MSDTVKPRAYNSPRRQAAARQTRQTILAAAGELFRAQGYSATTMALIAGRAGVALDTIYASVGPKPLLFRLLLETAISGADEPIPALERDYVLAIQAEPDARRKLALYAAAIASMQQRLAPLVRVIQEVTAAEPELAELWGEISERRARNMRLFVSDIAATGMLRPGLSIDEAADVIWATNASEFYLLLVHERGWEPARFERWLAETWARLLLAESPVPDDATPTHSGSETQDA